jgi:hypothetical protein
LNIDPQFSVPKKKLFQKKKKKEKRLEMNEIRQALNKYDFDRILSLGRELSDVDLELLQREFPLQVQRVNCLFCLVCQSILSCSFY